MIEKLPPGATEFIDYVIFCNKKIRIIFKSGQQLEATTPNEETYKKYQEEMINEIGLDRVIIK